MKGSHQNAPAIWGHSFAVAVTLGLLGALRLRWWLRHLFPAGQNALQRWFLRPASRANILSSLVATAVLPRARLGPQQNCSAGKLLLCPLIQTCSLRLGFGALEKAMHWLSRGERKRGSAENYSHSKLGLTPSRLVRFGQQRTKGRTTAQYGRQSLGFQVQFMRSKLGARCRLRQSFSLLAITDSTVGMECKKDGELDPTDEHPSSEAIVCPTFVNPNPFRLLDEKEDTIDTLAMMDNDLSPTSSAIVQLCNSAIVRSRRALTAHVKGAPRLVINPVFSK